MSINSISGQYFHIPFLKQLGGVGLLADKISLIAATKDRPDDFRWQFEMRECEYDVEWLRNHLGESAPNHVNDRLPL